jgi:hypothetical protein
MPSYKQEGMQPVPIQPGKHKIEIEFAENKTSQKSGNDYIRIKCRTEGGAIIYDNMPFAPGMGWKIDQMRESMGFAIVPGEEVNVEPEDLIGRCATVIIKLDDKNENGYHKIDRWMSPREVQPNPASSLKKSATKDDDSIPF